MKRLLGLSVLFVVLSVSVPSYGFFLIYNLSTTVKGADYDTDLKTTVPLKAYLVLNLNDISGDVVDANLIMYGKDTTKTKVYVQLNESDSAGFLSADIWYIGDYTFVDIWSYDNPFDFEMLLSGKEALKDIGFGAGDKVWVAGSIKGVNMVWDGFLLGAAGQDVSGTSNASASLYTVATKAVNRDSWTQDEIVDNLISILQNKGYVAATLP